MPLPVIVDLVLESSVGSPAGVMLTSCSVFISCHPPRQLEDVLNDLCVTVYIPVTPLALLCLSMF